MIQNWMTSLGPNGEMAVKVFFGSLFLGHFFLWLVLSMILNRKFDPFFAQDIEQLRRDGKSPAFPYYFLYKARDYAHALVRENFAQKTFGVSRFFFVSRCGFVSKALCYLFIPLEALSFAFFFPLGLALWIFG